VFGNMANGEKSGAVGEYYNLSDYYAIRELEQHVQALVDAHGNLDMALERGQGKIAALAEAYQKIEEQRAPLREAALSEAAE
jgi:hypothetical protein